jgi:hypothetical protein
MAQQYLGQQMDTDFRRGILANTQVKMTGMSANDSRAAIARETGIGESDLAGLGKGQFYVKVGNRPAFKFFVPSFLIGTKHAMAAEDWQAVKTQQLAQYYRPLAPRKDTADSRGGDPEE